MSPAGGVRARAAAYPRPEAGADCRPGAGSSGM